LRAFDIDNRAKALLDALEYAGLMTDDEQVDQLTLIRGEKIPGGLVIVEIEVLNDAPQDT